jgi:excinuclease UvrABC nuclease subunit
MKPIIVALAYGKQGEKANLVQLVYFNALDKAEKYVASVANEDKHTWTLAEIIGKGL